MKRVRVKEIGSGFHPSEVIVAVATANGKEERLVVDKRAITDGSILVGYPIEQSDNKMLVELPRETIRGIWRVWVCEDSLIEGSAA